MNLDMYKVLSGILDHLKETLQEDLSLQGLDTIEEWDIGYRDVVSGLHAHPALLVKSDRDYTSPDGPPYQRMELDLALVFRHEDPDEGYRMLCSYQGVIDARLRDDLHLGGYVAEIVNASFSKARDSSGTLFFLFLDMEIDIDVIAWRMD